LEEYEPLSQTRAVGLLGGTFDPIHYGHLVIAEEVRATLGLERMVFIPAGEPPHKPGRNVTPALHRLAMVELAITSNPYFALSHVELRRSGPSYLVDTLRLLHEEWGTNIALSFVIGWDSLEELHTWHDPLGILAQLAHLVAVGRPGYTDEKAYHTLLEQRLPGIMQRLLVVPVPQMDISSTDLRHRVTQGRPIKYQTPEPVERYIIEHKLYLDSMGTEGR
jgi:nicotinate-nucleotide adenylyltransferase